VPGSEGRNRIAQVGVEKRNSDRLRGITGWAVVVPNLSRKTIFGGYLVAKPLSTSRKLFNPASKFSIISSARSSGSGRLSKSVRLLSFSQNRSRLVLSRASNSSTPYFRQRPSGFFSGCQVSLRLDGFFGL